MRNAEAVGRGNQFAAVFAGDGRRQRPDVQGQRGQAGQDGHGVIVEVETPGDR